MRAGVDAFPEPCIMIGCTVLPLPSRIKAAATVLPCRALSFIPTPRPRQPATPNSITNHPQDTPFHRRVTHHTNALVETSSLVPITPLFERVQGRKSRIVGTGERRGHVGQLPGAGRAFPSLTQTQSGPCTAFNFQNTMTARVTGQRFRQRKLSTKQNLPIVRESEVEQLADDDASRHIPKVETGVEKGEEIVSHAKPFLAHIRSFLRLHVITYGSFPHTDYATRNTICKPSYRLLMRRHQARLAER